MSTLPATVREHTVLAAPVAGAAQRSGTPAGLTASDILRVLRRRMGLILVIWFLAMGLTVAGTYMWVKFWPSYSAFALINVQSTNPDKPYSGLWESPAFVKDQMERALRDQAMEIKSPEVLSLALQDDSVRETDWWKQEMQEDVNEATLDLQDRLSASPVRDSSMVQITFATRNPDDVAKIVNTIVRYYLSKLMSRVKGQFTDELRGLRTAHEEAQREVDTTIAEIEKFQGPDGQGALPGIMNQMSAIATNLERVGALKAEAAARHGMLRAQLEANEAVGVEKMPVTPEIAMAVEADPQIAGLEMRRQQYLEQRQVLLDRFGAQHREVREIEARIQQVDQDADARRKEKIDQYRQMQFDRTKLEEQMAASNLNAIMQQYDDAEAAQLDLDRKRAQLENLMRKQKGAEERLAAARKALDEMNLINSRPSIIRVSLAQNAVRPLERATPRWEMTIPAGLVLGLLLGAGLALMLEFMNTRVRTPQDVVRYAAMPVLGIVPVLDDEEVRIDDIDMVTRRAPRSLMAECFRRTRTNLLFSCPPDRQRTVAVISAQPEEGKTAVAVNLAVASAQSGRKVLLVDCNFRRPSLSRTFPHLKQQGLSNLLIGQCELKDLVTGTDIPTLDVMATGPTPPNPAELLGSTYFRAFLSEAAAAYDQVLLDGPPGLLVSDALVLAAAVDGVIVVSHAARTTRGTLRRLRDTLDRVGAHVLGVVLNAAEVQAGGYFKEMYRTYYDYDAQATKVLPGPNGKDADEVKPASRSEDKA